ncbi:DNA mismatch repair protein [Coemansia sp. RSA 2711]|nr:DNA mismatch repair protein [Coemansia sp. RSA 2711]KAJ2320619.1 DNA mismatch repair protein [Coemansia sp. RSA 2704]KAJ2327648.1 DNA mismatch repair protein Mlh1 [Coemansia sp. RSA 2702]KAJ2389243.1 DNA mismatch repair protein [Coemansia sp. RSA 2611]
MSSESAPIRPAPIRKLEEAVINRIAAGEIINRPSNALKELIENSLDAGATSIAVTVKDGGMKILQIQDNGHGIRTEDLPIVCERFTTSKLKVYEDLSHIQTYGFRGEALASISHVSHLTIATKQADSECAYKACYADGKLAPAKPGGSSEPVPCAGNNGTVITAEDLFYNIQSRKAALKNTREEYNRIFEVASRYAIHNAGVAFTCRKAGAPKVDLNTPAGATTIGNIRQIFGSKIASSLVEIKDADADLEIEFAGHVSSAAHEMHKSVFLLFINHRLVDHTPIRRAIESLYSSVLPKASRPFVYLDLRIKPENVDVNVHPTKREVRFLNEDSIISCIVDCIHGKLLSTNNSREFTMQSRLQKQPSASASADTPPLVPNASLSTIGSLDSPLSTPSLAPSRSGGFAVASSSRVSGGSHSNTPQKTPVNKAVRTNYKTLSLEAFSFGSSPSVRRNRLQTTIEPDFSVSASGTTPTRTPLRISPSRVNTGAAESRQVGDDDDAFADRAPAATRKQAENIAPLFPQEQTQTAPNTTAERDGAPSAPALDHHMSSEFPQLPETAPAMGKSYVAPKAEPRVEVRLTSILSLRKELQRQAHTELTQILSEHTFVGFVDDRRALIQHQTRLYMVNYCRISYHLFYHRCIFDFMNYGRLILQPAPSIYDLALMAATELGGIDAEKAASDVLSRFTDSQEMLEEYYHIKVSDTGTIESLPMVIRDYSPDYDKLPLFLYKAATSVNWDDEQQFFKTFTSELATFYALEPPLPEDPQNTKDDYRLVVEHRIMPSFKGSSFWAPGSILMENSLVQLVNLPDLYRIFERC